MKEIFALVTYRHKTFSALSQAGCVEKFVDALVWVFFPVYFYSIGLSLVEIGWIVGTYGLIWGASQLWTGPLSDRYGRKIPIVVGMWLAGLGVAATLMVDGLQAWLMTAAVTGVGMALLYPTLIAAVGDISHPNWRGSSLGGYRFWRDMGYGIGAVAMGLAAEFGGDITYGFWFVAGSMFFSGLWVLLMAEETHPAINPAEDKAGDHDKMQEVHSPYGYMEVVDLQQDGNARRDVLLIDARSPEEYSEAHVPRAINVPVDELGYYFAKNADQLYSTIVTMCGSSGRGEKAADKLLELGAHNVKVLKGGLEAWCDAGLPID